MELTLGEDLDKLANYLKMWRLKLSKSKPTATAFHLKTREANHLLPNNLEDTCHSPTPAYSAIKLDGQLTFRQHLKGVCANVTVRNNLLQRHGGADTLTNRTIALAVVYSAVEYTYPIWCCSKHTMKLGICSTIR